MSTSEHDKVDPATTAEDEAGLRASHHADREPTPEEEELAESNTLDPEVGEHFREMAETGANIKGEGEVE
jgi:hypothetical protein